MFEVLRDGLFGGFVIFEVLFNFVFRNRKKTRVLTCFNCHLLFVCLSFWFCLIVFVYFICFLIWDFYIFVVLFVWDDFIFDCNLFYEREFLE